MQTKFVYEKLELTIWRLLITFMDEIRFYIPKIEKRFVHIRKLVDQEPYIMPGMLAIFGLLVGFASALLLGF